MNQNHYVAGYIVHSHIQHNEHTYNDLHSVIVSLYYYIEQVNHLLIMYYVCSLQDC